MKDDEIALGQIARQRQFPRQPVDRIAGRTEDGAADRRASTAHALGRDHLDAVNVADQRQLGQPAIDPVVQEHMRAVAQRLHPGDMGEGIADQPAARLAHQHRTIGTEGLGRDPVDECEDRLERRRSRRLTMARETAADIEPRRRHPGHGADPGRGADIGVPGHRIGALRARMEGERGDEPCLGCPLQQFGRGLGRRAELGAEMIGRARDRQLEAHRDLGALGRHHLDQLLELGNGIDRPGLHPGLHRMGDLGPRAHRVVVMQRRPRGETAHEVDLERRGNIEAAHAGGHEVLDHHLVGVRLDGIGHDTRKAADEAPRARLQRGGREHQHRVLGLLVTDDFGRRRPDRLRQSHRLLPRQQNCSHLLPRLHGSGDAYSVSTNQARCV
ncbi:hypothetical protein SDC9_21368 [bioreactor metagenome]|uniref:Uncharacterized protein n=1 Tax=bioreactor metagenome TaxID=1076179 RepID=A0A644U9C5_9ZZZZ